MSGETSKRAKGREERRTRVLETAMHLADEGGYDAVQMRTVAERSGVALGTIYRYFSGKDEMLVAGMAGWLRVTRKRVEVGIRGDTPFERLSWLLERTANTTVRNPVLMCALVRAFGNTGEAAAELKWEVHHEVHAIVVTALGPDPGVDADGIARVIGHVWSSSLNRWAGGLAPAASVAEELQHAVQLMLGPPVSAG